MQRYRFPLRVGGSLIVILGSVLLIVSLLGHVPTYATGSAADWTTYLHDPGHSGFNSTETILNPSSASQLRALWTINEGSTISTQAVVANGLIYWGSWDGFEHATNLDGSQAWVTNLGTAPSNCGSTLGVLSTATVASVSINGTLTSVVFVGSATDTFYALNASTGAILWHTSLGTPATQVLWSSPVLYNGSIYIGIASNDCPLVQGQVFQLNATSGAIQNTFNVVPNGCVGPGVWGSVTIDASNGTLYFVTGNAGTCSQPETMAEAIVQLKASNLAFMSSWQVPSAASNGDLDFGSTPTLFTATIGGTVHNLLGAANKNGIYYAFDEANISAGPVWTVTVAQSGNAPEFGDGSISPSAWDGTNLYVGGGKTTINGGSCSGGLRALNPATGAIVWQRCAIDGPVIGAVTAVPGVVAVGEGTALWLVATSDGHDLFKTWDTSTNSQYYEGPTIANGVLYIGNKNGHFSAYGGLSTPTPTPSPTPTNTMVPSPTPTLSPTVTLSPSPTPGTTIAQDTFHRANQALWGTASDGHTWGGDANTVSAFSIVNNTGQISNGNGIYNAVLGSTATDAEVLFNGSMSSYSNTNLGAVLRWSNTNNWYKAYINSTSLVVQKKVNGATTILGSVPFTATSNTSYTLRFRVVGTTLYAKVWQTGTTEPTNWMITVTDTTFSSGFCGLRMQVASGITASYTSFLATAPGGTPTPTPSPSPSPSPNPSPSPSPSPNPSPSPSPSPNPSPSPTVTVTPSPSPTPGTILAQDTFQRPNQALWGKASDGHTWGGDANTVSAFSIVNNTGHVFNSGTSYSAVLGPAATNAEVVFTGAMTNYSSNNLGAVLRWTDGNNWYKAYINSTSLVVQKKVNGATTIIGSVPFTATSNTSYTLRFRVVGTTLYAKVWQTGTTEPTNWMITVTDTTFSSGFCGLRMLALSNATASYTSFLATAK